jgi:hypothetical protein
MSDKLHELAKDFPQQARALAEKIHEETEELAHSRSAKGPGGAQVCTNITPPPSQEGLRTMARQLFEIALAVEQARF